jgi:hypothetical protein
MKNFWAFIIVAFSLLGFFGCNDAGPNPGLIVPGSSILGTWQLVGSDSTGTGIYMKVVKLDSACYGFHFEADGSMFERRTDGRCGTPPVSYRNFQGNWKMVSGTELAISTGNWVGIVNFDLQIVSVSSSTLCMKRLNEEMIFK